MCNHMNRRRSLRAYQLEEVKFFSKRLDREEYNGHTPERLKLLWPLKKKEDERYIVQTHIKL